MAVPDDVKATVRVACVAASDVVIANALKPGQVIGGRTLIEDDLIGLVAQGNAAQNGLYRSNPVPERDANYGSIKHGVNGAYDLFPGMMISDEQTAKVYRCTSQRGGTLDVTAITFEAMPTQADISGIVAGVGLAMPAGVIMAYGGGTVPSQWLYCNGAAVSRTTYAALYAAITTWWGAGNGSTTFNLPDLRGRGIAGYDNAGTGRLVGRTNGVNAGTLGSAGGLDYEYVTTANMPAHSHLHQGAVACGVGGENVDHAHGVNINSGNISADHQHLINVNSNNNTRNDGSTERYNSGAAAAFWSGTMSAHHYHNVSGATAGRNAGHVHSVTTPAFWIDNAGGGGYVNTVQPTAICMYIIHAGV